MINQNLNQEGRLKQRFAYLARCLLLPAAQSRIYTELLSNAEREQLDWVADETLRVMKAESKGSDSRNLDDLTPFDCLIQNGERNIWRIARSRNLSPEKLAMIFSYELGFLRGEPEYRRLLCKFTGADTKSRCGAIMFTGSELVINQKVVCKVTPEQNF